MLIILSTIIFVVAGPAWADGHLSELSAEERAVVERARAWIEEGWSPKEGAPGFSFERMADFYSDEDGTLSLHDDNDPTMGVRHSARAHFDAFAPLVRSQSFLDNEWTSLENVAVAADLALTVFTADAIFRDGAGVESRLPLLYSLGWRRDDDGQWRIFHEHGTSLSVN